MHAHTSPPHCASTATQVVPRLFIQARTALCLCLVCCCIIIAHQVRQRLDFGTVDDALIDHSPGCHSCPAPCTSHTPHQASLHIALEIGQLEPWKGPEATPYIPSPSAFELMRPNRRVLLSSSTPPVPRRVVFSRASVGFTS